MEFVIEVQGLRKSFGDHTVLDNVNLKVPKGKIFGLLGPNGAGKTTTIRILSCLIEPSGGNITILGHSLQTQKDKIRRLIGCVTESPGTYDKMSVWDNLDFFGSCYDIPNPKRAERIESLLKEFDLWAKKDAPAGSLSKGMKQKVSIIRALLHDPDILFLDEVTANLDPVSSRHLKDLIKQWAANGKTIIYCSHVLSEVEELCHEFAIIKGNIIRHTTPQKFREEWSFYNVSLTVSEKHKETADILQNASGVLSYKQEENEFLLKVEDPDHSNPSLLKELISADIPVTYMHKLVVSLEDSYLSLLKQEQEEN